MDLGLGARGGVTVAGGYLAGSVPVAVLAGRRAGIDVRSVGDRNPGYWNAKEALGRRSALPVFVGDVAKGAAGAGLGRALGGPWWMGYLGGLSAMAGHAWPVFAGFRGGRSVLTFAGAALVVTPVAAAVSVAGCAGVAVATGRFEYGARVGVFGLPVVQLLVDPPRRVAATGVLMTLIGVRFVQAFRSGTTAPATSDPVAGSAG